MAPGGTLGGPYATKSPIRHANSRGPHGVLALGLALAAAAFGCGAEPSDTGAHSTRAIVARVADGSAPLGAGAAVEPVRIGSARRPAVCRTGPGAFEVESPVGADAVGFGVAKRDQAVGVERQALLRVSRRFDGAWQRIAEETIQLSAREWRDRWLPLDAGAASLRFEIVEAPKQVPLCFGGIVFAGARESGRRLPNVVLFSLDTLGAAYLGAYGAPPAVSPHLDALHARSYVFERAFAPFHNTFVSHSSLFSGLHPAHHGRLSGTKIGGRPPLASLVPRLATAGYHTAAVTEDAWVASRLGFAQGFDHFDDGDSADDRSIEGNAPVTFRNALAWLDTHAAAAPFFLFVHTYEVHTPYRPRDAEAMAVADARTPGDRRVFDPVELHRRMTRHNERAPVLSEPDLRRMRALYDGEIQLLDREMARFVERLDADGRLENTLIVVTADHGELFGEHGLVGHTGYHNHVLHVPLAFHWPGRIAPGRSAPPVQLVDLLPTVFDLVGLELPDGLDGHSLAPELRAGAPAPVERIAVSESRYPRRGCDARAEPSCWTERRIAQTRRFKRVRGVVSAADALFDLAADPDEVRDVSAAHPEVVTQLDAHLDAVYREDSALPAQSDEASQLDPELRRRLEALGYATEPDGS